MTRRACRILRGASEASTSRTIGSLLLSRRSSAGRAGEVDRARDNRTARWSGRLLDLTGTLLRKAARKQHDDDTPPARNRKRLRLQERGAQCEGSELFLRSDQGRTGTGVEPVNCFSNATLARAALRIGSTVSSSFSP